MTTIPSTHTATWAICHGSCFGKEDRQLKTAGGTGIRGQDHTDIHTLARQMDTSVLMLERHYSKLTATLAAGKLA